MVPFPMAALCYCAPALAGSGPTGRVTWAPLNGVWRPYPCFTFPAYILPPRSICCRNGASRRWVLDTPSIDYGQSKGFESHVTLFEANVPAFENLANLDRLPATGFFVVALPMKIRGGSGAPLRVVAVVPD